MYLSATDIENYLDLIDARLRDLWQVAVIPGEHQDGSPGPSRATTIVYFEHTQTLEAMQYVLDVLGVEREYSQYRCSCVIEASSNHKVDRLNRDAIIRENTEKFLQMTGDGDVCYGGYPLSRSQSVECYDAMIPLDSGMGEAPCGLEEP